MGNGTYKNLQNSPYDVHYSPPSNISLTPNLHSSEKKDDMIYSKKFILNNNEKIVSQSHEVSEENQRVQNLNIFKNVNFQNWAYDKVNLETTGAADFLQNKIKKRGKSYKGLDLKKFSIDDFEFGSKLGKGKYGDVYIARELKTNLIVGIKVLNKDKIRELRAQKQVRKIIF